MSAALKTQPRRYEQWCPTARSLDLVGERWTLLVVRDLLMGPRRYTDLRESNPGIGTDLLTARLRSLERAGYVQRRKLPRPAAVTVYELTASGWRLGRLVLELARLGIENVGPPEPGQEVNADALVLSLIASFRPDRAGDPASYELTLDGEPFTVAVRDGAVETARGPADDPRLAIATDAYTLARLLTGALDPGAAIAAGELQLTGRRRDLDRFLRAFAYPR